MIHACRKGKAGPTKHRHDALIHTFARYARLAGVAAHVESPLRNAKGQRQRPDALIAIPRDLVYIDVSVVCAESPSYLKSDVAKAIEKREAVQSRVRCCRRSFHSDGDGYSWYTW